MAVLAHNINKTRILIVNDRRDCGASYSPLFRSQGNITNDPNALMLQPFTFKLIVFTGGADVSPSLYGDKSPDGVCHSSTERDDQELKIYKYAQNRGIPMVGICRGMQFLNVMTGGKMIHDLGGHSVGSHEVMTRDKDEPFITNSFHHQMCVPHKSTHLLAWSHTKLSKRYIGNEDKAIDYIGPEVEAIYMPWLKAIGVQWHPEATPDSGKWVAATSWFNHLLQDLLMQTPIKFRKLYLGDYEQINIIEVA